MNLPETIFWESATRYVLSKLASMNIKRHWSERLWVSY